GMAESWAGPEEERLVPSLSPIRGDPTLVLDDYVLAELVPKLVDDEIGCRLCGEPSGFHTLDALEDDSVVLADLRMVRHEARVFQHRRRRRQRPTFVADLRHRLPAVIDARAV